MENGMAPAKKKITIIKMDPAYPLNKIKPYEKNPRVNDHAVEAIANSLKEFGEVAPIVVDEKGRICAGHTRYKAATKLGWSTFPVIVCKFPNDKAFKGYNIADNQTSQIADWDYPELASAIASLANTDFNVDSLGFNEEELENINKALGQDINLTQAPVHSEPPFDGVVVEMKITEPVWHKIAQKIMSYKDLDGYAFSDPQANEIRTVYQATNWHYLGQAQEKLNTDSRYVNHLKGLGYVRENNPKKGAYCYILADGDGGRKLFATIAPLITA